MDRRKYWAAVVLLGVCAIYSVATGVASFLSIAPRSFLDEWSSGGGMPSAERISLEGRRMMVAHRLDPLNPEYLESLARFRLMAAPTQKEAGARRAILGEGLGYARKALALRPVSPYGWADLLDLKSALGEVDAEYAGALSNALALGPWEPGVQLVLARTGLADWNALGQESRKASRMNFLDALATQPQNLPGLARKRCAKPGTC